MIAACSYPAKRPTKPLLHGYHKIGIVPALYVPETDFDPFFARGPMAGAVKGAGVGGIGGIVVLGSAASLYGAVVGILLLPVTVPAGAIAGSLAQTPETEAKRIDILIAEALEQDDFQLQFGKRIADHAVFFPSVERNLVLDTGPDSAKSIRDYQELYEDGFDAILEVAIQEIGFEDYSGTDRLRLSISAKVRVVATKDKETLLNYELSYRSAERTLAAWIRSEGKLLANTIAAGIDYLAFKLVYKTLGQPAM